MVHPLMLGDEKMPNLFPINVAELSPTWALRITHSVPNG